MHFNSNRAPLIIALVFKWFMWPAMMVAAEEPEAGNVTQGEAADFYVQTKLYQFDLELTESEWGAMAAIDPRRGGPPVEFLPKANGGQRAVHRGRFPWAVGLLTINGETLNRVGVRYKGNASYNLMHGSLKRNLKIKIDWTDDDQHYSGVKTLNMNAGGL